MYVADNVAFTEIFAATSQGLLVAPATYGRLLQGTVTVHQ